MISFQKPLYLLLILLLPLYALFRHFELCKPLYLPLSLGNWNGFEPKKHAHLYFLHRVSRYLLAAAFASVTVSLAEPVYLTTKPLYSQEGQAVMFVLDVSPSMAAQDMGAETRLATAKRVISSFVQQHEGDSFGLTALGSTAAVLLPPTIDRDTFKMRLENLQPGELGEGTAIGMGLGAAVLHLNRYTKTAAHIILLTDGDNNTGAVHPRSAAEIIKHKNIGFSVIGVGKSGYAPVHYFDAVQNKDIQGTLQTVFDETELRNIARYGNGRYFSAQAPELLQEVFRTLAKNIPATPASLTTQTVNPVDSFFLAAALALAAAAWLILRGLLKAVLV